MWILAPPSFIWREPPIPANFVDGRPFLGSKIDAASIDARDSVLGYADRFDEKYDLVRTLGSDVLNMSEATSRSTSMACTITIATQMAAYRQWRELFRQGQLQAPRNQFFLPRPPESLFDIEADPHEVTDLAADPKYSAILNEMRRKLDSKLKAMPDLSFFPRATSPKRLLKDPVEFGKSHQLEIAGLIDVATSPSFRGKRPNRKCASP